MPLRKRDCVTIKRGKTATASEASERRPRRPLVVRLQGGADECPENMMGITTGHPALAGYQASQFVGIYPRRDVETTGRRKGRKIKAPCLSLALVRRTLRLQTAFYAAFCTGFVPTSFILSMNTPVQVERTERTRLNRVEQEVTENTGFLGVQTARNWRSRQDSNLRQSA